jgi:hypothetical protein
MNALLLLMILFDGWGAYQAPGAGNPVTPILEAVRTDTASNGENFLVVWYASDGVRLGIFEQGAVAPRFSTLLDDELDEAHPPVTTWAGSRYLVFWTSGGMAHAVAMTADGEIVQRADLPGVSSADDVAANGPTIALMQSFTTPTHSGNVDVILLNAEFEILRRTHAGSIKASGGGGITYLREPVIASFGDGYYAAWIQVRTARYEEVVGTRITADGTALDVIPSTRERDSLMGTPLETHLGSGLEIFDLDLVAYRSRILVVMKREWGYEVTASAVNTAGAVEGPVHVGGKFNMPTNATTTFLPDGTPALTWFEEDRIAVVQSFQALVAPPRRRATRH